MSEVDTAKVHSGPTKRSPRVAIVHDWLTVYGGAERVLEEMLRVWPQADLFALVDFLPTEQRKFLAGRTVRTSFIQRLPGAKRHYRSYLPLMPLAVEQFDVSAYDIVLSSSFAVAKGVITGPDQLHVSYVHSPIRYAWDLQHQYLRESGMESGVKGGFARLVLHYIRIWDQRTANGVDQFVANSRFIARRIAKAYRRSSEVIYPPVDVDCFELRIKKEDFYLTASRLVPYKRVPLIAEAFSSMPGRRLIVVGDGPDMARLKSLAGANVEVLGYRSTAELVSLMQRAKAFVFAAEEDFGITPVEAQACGTPVIAFRKGGAVETVRGLDEHDQPTGVFFGEQTVEAICEAVARFESRCAQISAHACRMQAELFAPTRFRESLERAVNNAWLARAHPAID